MRIAFTDENDDTFTLIIKDESLADKVAELMKKGVGVWYCATHPEDYGDNDFTREEVEAFYYDGYADPTCKLLEKEGIEYELVDTEYNEDGGLIADRIVWG